MVFNCLFDYLFGNLLDYLVSLKIEGIALLSFKFENINVLDNNNEVNMIGKQMNMLNVPMDILISHCMKRKLNDLYI